MEILKGKGAVVTGAASGIGKAIATAFVEAGASVLLCDVNAKGLDTVARQLGDRAIGRVTDVADENQVEAAMRAAREAFGSLDIVVNCAGFGAIMPLTELPADKWRSVHGVTLGGVFHGVKHGARQMLEQGRPGVIINISSVNARHPMEANSAYCAAKAGVDMITRCGALELGQRHVSSVSRRPWHAGFLIPSRFVITTNVSVLSRRHCGQERAILPRCRHRFRSTPPMYLL